MPPDPAFLMASHLNDIKDNELAALKKKYGEPEVHAFTADFRKFECTLVKRTEAKGRLHDITCFIRQDDGNFVVIQKPQYARTGIYRAPSGGANPGEPLEDAAIREMYEETGLTVRLTRFVLDMHLEVVCKDRTIPWRSLVFLAEPVVGEIKPVDTREIFDATVMSRGQLVGEVAQLMEDSGWGGFKYRAFLTREFFRRLDELNI
ncbi:MAG: NUDIX hydrolase [Candidatus Thorarchaeota archaeon]|nr:NUDIX hydrolase [Candidatus Thorarchaeota archaeon]